MPDPTETPPDPTPEPTSEPTSPSGEAPPAPPTPAPPPAAKTVLEGRKTEGELALERKLKERETRLAELEDENRVLKTPPPRPKPAAPPEKKSWLSGATFFEGAD